MSDAVTIKSQYKQAAGSWSLIKQVMIVIGMLILLLAIGANTVIKNIEAEYLNRLLEAESERTTTLVAQAALEGIISEDIPHLQTIVEQVGKNTTSIISITIFSYDDKELTAWNNREPFNQAEYVIWRKPVILEGEEFGYIIIHWRTDIINLQVDKHVSYLSSLVLILVLIVGLSSFLLIHWLIISPIQIINTNLRLLQEKGNVVINDNKLPIYSAQELLNLSGTVKEISRLWNQNREREQHLEQEVELRKNAEKELMVHRDNLQQEVAEKTAELLQAMESARRANRSKSIFLANMSHELRTPMHAILSFSQFGLQKYDVLKSQKLKSYFGNINESANRLLLLLNDLLDLAKLEAGKMELNIQSNDICQVINSSIVELGAAIEEKGLTAKVDCEQAILIARFDRLRISQVVVNYLSNAIKFTPANKNIMINVQNRTKGIEVTVHDEGEGIPNGEYELVFERFEQSSNKEAHQKGTGLGLSICKEIVELHGGKVWAEASDIGGAAFKFFIPFDAP